VNRFIDWFAGNHVAANLLMIMLILGGLLTVQSIKQEVFPDVDLDMVTVQVPYLGASPAEVEEGVCVRIEEAIQGIDGIKRITSTAVENSGSVMAELRLDADPQKVLDDIKQAVDRIITFPDETEKPIINLAESTERAIDIVVYGDVSENALKNVAENIRDDLLAGGVITQANLVGTRPYEISIEVSDETLRRHGLTMAQVSAAVRRGSLDMPGGSVKTKGGEILIRTKGQKYTGAELASIVVMQRPDGTRLTLEDIARIHDDFEDVDSRSIFDGKSAASIAVFRVGAQAILDVTGEVHEYVRDNAEALPEGLMMTTWSDRSLIYKSRMNLMLKNGVLGLILVFICLALFLQPRLAFWVALGIPISFMGGFWLVPSFGASLNMISMFAFIVVLGLVVDDAIVVGENIYYYRQQGLGRHEATVKGTTEVASPVILAILTTVFAFLPLAFVEGTMGKFMGVIPVIVIAVLAVSLVEGLLILPAHLSTIPASSINPDPDKKRNFLLRFQDRFAEGFQKFIINVYKPSLIYALKHRALVLAVAVASLVLLAGFVGGGHIRFTFMPNIDSDNMICAIEMPAGTSVETTTQVVEQIQDGLRKLQEEVDGDREEGTDPIIKHVYSTIGSQPRTSGGGRPMSSGTSTFLGAHKAEINVELMEGEARPIGSKELVGRWRKLSGEIPGALSVTFSSNLFGAANPLSIQLSTHDIDMLTEASERLKTALSGYPGVQDITDSYAEGKLELKLDLKPTAGLLGITLDDLARQVRQGFYGDEARRLQRGRDDVRVMVRYPREQRKAVADLENMMIRTATGVEVPFRQVASVDVGRGYATINRVDRRRIVDVQADIDQDVTNAAEIIADLQKSVLPNLKADYPSLRYSFEGEERDRQESLQSMGRGFQLALIAIYAILAVLFRSYMQPLIIMSAIPFGFLGAVMGHVLMGWDLTLLSMFGVVALTGVVVNDSLIMIDFINRNRNEGMSLWDAVVGSGVRRFRPIILTSLTTFAGLTPMLLEKSLQARFLIPMAISLGFGVLFATAITLILIPVGYLLLEDFKRFLGFGGHKTES
jgi:multidrug efflux pump subunit AcrB